jgi:hypothetical protein
MGTQPQSDAPWLAVVSPAELGGDSPLLLDWLVWNAPLQNLRAGDARWRLRITVNDDSFVVDQQDALWLQGIDNRSGINTVQMELLNGIGESLEPMFNNQLRAVPERQSPKPIWLQSSLNDTQLARLLGEAKPEDRSATQELVDEDDILGLEGAETTAPKEQVLKKEPIQENEKVVNEGAEADPAMPEQDNAETSLDIEALAVENAEPETSKPDAARTTSLPEQANPEAAIPEAAIPKKSVDSPEGSSKTTNPKPPAPDKKPIVIKEPERISPTSTLGGSARELLNADGTQR